MLRVPEPCFFDHRGWFATASQFLEDMDPLTYRDSLSPPVGAYGHNCERTGDCPECFRISEYCEELSSTIDFAIQRVEVTEAERDHLRERVRELRTELSQARNALKYTFFEVWDDDGTPLTRRGMQPIKVEQHAEEQIYRSPTAKIPEFLHRPATAPFQPHMMSPSENTEWDTKQIQRFSYHPRHIGIDAGTEYETVRWQAREAAGREFNALRAQYETLAGSGMPLKPDQQIRFAQTLIKNNTMAQPIIIHAPIVNYLDGINHTRIIVDTREEALSMASFNMFQNDDGIRYFAHTPFVHYPFELPDAELATHDAEVNVQFGTFNFHDDIAVGLTKRWKHERIVLGINDFMKVLVDIDMESHVLELYLGGNVYTCRFYWYCDHLYRSAFEQDRLIGRALARENVHAQLNYLYGGRQHTINSAARVSPVIIEGPPQAPAPSPEFSPSSTHVSATPEQSERGSDDGNEYESFLTPQPSSPTNSSTADTVILTTLENIAPSPSQAESSDCLAATLPPTPGGYEDISEEEDPHNLAWIPLPEDAYMP
ncbi:hypothetical protein V9T40_006499 [Parthenolecanium corni]|uniref:Uncharacterized protein n=1 Tax=Parthenolecanium corni TaxID=536013 RepID=A0AAN9Y5K8_9HEMI